MSQVPTTSRLEIPSSLAHQLYQFRRLVWKAKMAESIGFAIAGLAAMYLVVFTLDRLWDTPVWLRAVAALAALAAILTVPYYLHRWVWNYRGLKQLTRLLSRKLPSVGDQLLGVLELAEHQEQQTGSLRLCHAAIEQVAADAKQRDFRTAMPDSRTGMAISMAAVAAGCVALLFLLFPLAAQNAWARFSAPWQGTPRYTFAAMQPIAGEMVVPHGEPFPVSLQLAADTAWSPDEAKLFLNSQEIVAQRNGDRYQFEIPPQIAAGSLSLSAGDWSQSVAYQPVLRPELTGVHAQVTLPEYLQRTALLEMDVRGGSLSVVRGSQVNFTASATRELSSAAIQNEPAVVSGQTFAASPIAANETGDVRFDWQDIHQLKGKEPFQLSLNVEDDQAPTLLCNGLPHKKVVLDTEQILFQVTARDDFGVREVGMQWRSAGGDLLVDSPAIGEKLLASGGPEKTAMEVQGTFTAKSLGIEPQPLEVQIFVTDYLPEREATVSATYLLYVLNAEQHAIWVTEQLARWHRQSLEIRDREMQLYETNKQLRDLSPEELATPETQRQLEKQASAEKANGRNLSGLTQNGEELLRQAARNPEIGVGHLERWAEMLKILNDISQNRMPSVADLLQEGAESKPGTQKASQALAQSKPTAGQNRAQGGPGKPTEMNPGDPPPVVPSITDMESSQQPIAQSEEQQEAQKKNPSAPRLTLPNTTVMGKPSNAPPVPAPPVEQAVVEQQDLLQEFEKVANELNEVLANLEGSTLIKRLKAESRKHDQIADRIADRVDFAFGFESMRRPVDIEAFDSLSEQVDGSSSTVSLIMDDMQAYFERRRVSKFKLVLDDMRNEDVLSSLRRLAEDLKGEPGLSLAQCEFWSDTLDRWAEDLVDPAGSGSCPGGRSKGSLPPSIILEVLQILEGEVNLREETRVAEQAREGIEADKFADEASRLSESQQTLETRVHKVIDRIRELPDAAAEFGKEIKLLGQVAYVMKDAGDILGKPDTGAPAIAAETEAIELLLQSKRINPSGGGGGGDSPGGGGGGDTEDAALALLGAGLNKDEVKNAPSVSQNVGTTDKTLPEEFRAGLDQYFDQIEKPGGEN